MKRVALANGIIAGFIISGIMVVTHPLVDDGTIDIDNGMWLGYGSMLLGFAFIFVAIKVYRDRVLNGMITFWQACQVGFLVTLIASLIYAVTWDVYYRVTGSEFTEKYTAHYLEKMEREGATAEEMASMRTEMQNFNRLYENTFVRFGVSLMDIVPVGVLISLIAAGILRRSSVYRAT